MGARILRTGITSRRQSRREAKTLATILIAVGLPVLLAYVLVTMDIRVDLSELRAAVITVSEEDASLVGWSDLARRTGEGPARMLGYMMDGDQSSRDGAPVTMFVLMPEAGQFLHAAHRIPEEMVEVRMRDPKPFRYRQLVWAVGRLSRTMGSDRDHAAWAMINANVEPASEREITRWFSP